MRKCKRKKIIPENAALVKLRVTLKFCLKELEKYESINIRINSAGCLDFCEQGPTVVIYPESIWYSIKSPEKDIPEIVQEHLINGKTVERCLIKL